MIADALSQPLDAPLDADAVRNALRADPDILRADPGLMAELIGPADGDRVVDLNAVARRRQEQELARLRAANARLIEIAKANLAAQAQVHAAVLAVLEADSLADLDRRLAGRVAGPLGLDALSLFIESCEPLARPRAVFAAGEGFVRAVLGPDTERLGPVDPRQGEALYGPLAERLASQALISLAVAGRPAVLCLASRGARTFTADQGSDLACFLARTLERRIGPWLAD